MKPTFYVLCSFFVFALFASCDDDTQVTPTLEVPATYTFTRNGESTVSFSGQSARIAMAEALATALLDFDKTEVELNNMFRNTAGTMPFDDAALNESDKSIRSKVASSQDLFFTNATRSAEIVADFDGWLSAQATEVFPAANQLADVGQAGQIADGSSVRYVNSWGLEYNQAFTKSLIGGLMYDQIVNNYLSVDVLDAGTRRTDNDAAVTEENEAYTAMEHRWDEAYGYLFGASASPATPLADLETADSFLNKYLGRVENDADYTGIAATIEAAFRRGRAAIVAADYDTRDEQAAIIKENLSKVIAVRAIYYMMQGKAALESIPANYGTAFHDLSEGYGFIYAMRFFNGGDSNATINFDEEADRLLTLLENADGNGFWDLSPTVLEDIAQQIALTTGLSLTEAGS